MNIVLFINGSLGLRILKYFTNFDDYSIVSIYVNESAKRTVGYIGEIQSLLDSKNLQPMILSWAGDSNQIKNCGVSLEQATFGVSALFGHIIPPEMVGRFSGGIINLHPSYLPIGRGADPIPWSIINRHPQGITLHLIDQQLDTGDVVFQKEIVTSIDMSAGDIYEIAMSELFFEFTVYFPKWVAGELKPTPQEGSCISKHKLSELNAVQIIDENEVGTFGDFVRRLQANTFSNGRRPSFKDGVGNIWEVTFRISDPQNIEQLGRK